MERPVYQFKFSESGRNENTLSLTMEGRSKSHGIALLTEDVTSNCTSFVTTDLSISANIAPPSTAFIP